MPVKPVPYTSFPVYKENKVETDGVSIFQFVPALELKNEGYIYKEDIFTIPSVKVMTGFVDNNSHHWLIFITDESFLKLASIVIYNDGKKDDAAIKSVSEEFAKNCNVALLVDAIPSWKELSRVLHEKKVFIKASNRKIPLSTSISTKSEAIEVGSKLLKAVIDKALEKNYPDLIRSLPRLNEIYSDDDINPLLKELGINEGVSISPKITAPFFGKQIDFIISPDQLEQIPEQTMVDGQPFDTGEFIPECFPYEGEFPFVTAKFTPTEIPQKKSGGGWNSGGASVTVEGYKAEQGLKNFISFKNDEQLNLAISSLDEPSKISVYLSLAGVPSIPNHLQLKSSAEKEPLTSFFDAKQADQTEIISEEMHEKIEEHKQQDKSTRNSSKAK